MTLCCEGAARFKDASVIVESVNRGRKKTLHRNLLLPVESVREGDPEVSTESMAIQKVRPLAKTNRTPESISAMLKQLLREDEAKGK